MYMYMFKHLQVQFLEASLVSAKAQFKLVRRSHTTWDWKSDRGAHLMHSTPPSQSSISQDYSNAEVLF